MVIIVSENLPHSFSHTFVNADVFSNCIYISFMPVSPILSGNVLGLFFSFFNIVILCSRMKGVQLSVSILVLPRGNRDWRTVKEKWR